MLVDDILPHELSQRRLKKLPKAAVPPQLKPRALKVLGTEDADALRLEAQDLFNVASLLLKAEAARVRREAQGISDRVEAAQPLTPPPFNTKLVGKRFEICWAYKENGKTVKIWASGVVKRVADGLSDSGNNAYSGRVCGPVRPGRRLYTARIARIVSQTHARPNQRVSPHHNASRSTASIGPF
jgi:hypothetical protein